jgi:hypothetical protein
MKGPKLVLTLVILIAVTLQLGASGTVSIYALVEKVVFEPDNRAPERIQIWGAFTLADGRVAGAPTLTPQRGYMYFSLPASPALREPVLKEWADFKAVAGTGQAVAFGDVGYIGAFTDELISRPAGKPPYLLLPVTPDNPVQARNILRPESAVPPSNPDPYIVNAGVVKLSNSGNLSAVINKLHMALTR